MPSLKNRKPNRLLLAFLPLALGPRLAAAAPEAAALLDSAMNPPDIAYAGRMMVTHWFGKQARAEEVDVYHNPPNLSRREYLAPDGSVSRFVISDGEREEVHLIKQKKVLRGDAVKSYAKLMSPERERELLLKNYGLSVVGAEKVAGRTAWVLELKPALAGKPYQKLWIDQDTRIVLENKRYTPRKSFAALSRFTQIELNKILPDSLFALELGSAAVSGKGLEPDFMTLPQLNEATGKSANFPPELPGGFVFESADFIEIGRQTVRHARYTDGLAVVSLFETDKPVRVPKTGAVVSAQSKGAGTLRLSSSGKVLHWRRGKRYLTLMGDVSRDLLQGIAASLK